MEKRETSAVVINLPLFKLIGLYRMLNMDYSSVGPKCQKLNAFTVFIVVSIIVLMSLNAISVAQGIFLATGGRSGSRAKLYQQILFYTNCTISAYKLMVIVCQARVVREFFDVSHMEFLTATPCRLHGSLILSRCRDQSTTLTTYYFRMFSVICAMWMLIPLTLVHQWTTTVRHSNALDLDYPWISVNAYNQYFAVFYAIEASLVALTSYGIVVFDVFLMSFCWAISAQYDTVYAAFRRFVNSDNEREENNIYYTLQSIISDNQHIFQKLQKFYDVIRPVVLIQVAVSSCSVVVLTILIALNYTSGTTFFTAENSKYITTLISLAVELFIYCSLIENLNDKKKSVNLSLYKSDWIKMDIRTKKLLLFEMKMNDANQLTLKMTPRTLINRALFISVMHTSYSVVSVLLNNTKQN